MKKFFIILLFAAGSLAFIFSRLKIKPEKNNIVIPSLSINKADTSLHVINGLYYVKQQLFSGTITDAYTDGKIHHQVECWLGKEEGWTTIYYSDGSVAEKRYYHSGEKDSVHTGWWENGKLRFEYHFNYGVYNGNYKEWYKTGQAYKFIHYKNGIDAWGKGWREGGKLFMNYTMVNGRRYGIVNSNLCYTVKNERGEFSNKDPLLK